MADLSQPNNPFLSSADDHLSRLLVSEVEEPWYRSFIQNLKDYINPPKLPPLELTSKPVAVKEIWGLYGRQGKSFMMSTGFQVVVVAVVVWLGMTKPVQQAAKSVMNLVLPPDIADFQPKSRAQETSYEWWRRWRRPVAVAGQQGEGAEICVAAVHASPAGNR